MELFITKHAMDQARERGISISEIKETIQKGAKFVQDEKERKIASDYRHMRVIFKKIENKYYVITVMIRR